MSCARAGQASRVVAVSQIGRSSSNVQMERMKAERKEADEVQEGENDEAANQTPTEEAAPSGKERWAARPGAGGRRGGA